MRNEERRKLRKYIAKLFNCGWNNYEVVREIFGSNMILVFGYVIYPVDLIAVIRDVMADPHCEEK